MSMNARIDLSGKRFGRLVALNIGVPKRSPSRVNVTWDCLCDCGAVVTVRRNSLQSGMSQSCGCSYKDLGIRKRTSRHENKEEYTAWFQMKQRCTNQNNKDFHNYGGRGISVCEKWIKSFDQFFLDMGSRPSDKHSLDRIDVDGNYTPENCRWATSKDQSRNKRNNVFIDFGGKRQVVADWAKEIGIHWASLYERLQKHPLHIALTSKKGMKNGS